MAYNNNSTAYFVSIWLPVFALQLDSHIFKGAGNFHGARMWYDELPNDIKDRIQDINFEDFILALPDTQG